MNNVILMEGILINENDEDINILIDEICDQQLCAENIITHQNGQFRIIDIEDITDYNQDPPYYCIGKGIIRRIC